MAWRAPGAGELRDRVSIRRRSQVSDGMGGTEYVFADILTNIPARIIATRGGEAVQSLRLSGTAPADIVLRACADTLDIGPADIVINDRTGRAYNIKWAGTLEEGRQSFVMLACVAGEVATNG